MKQKRFLRAALIVVILFSMFFTNVSYKAYADNDSVPVTGVAIKNNVSPMTIMSNDYQTLEAIVSPSNATDAELIWESDNDEVLSVFPDGSLIPWEAGHAKITVSVDGTDFKDSVEVTVSDLEVSGHPYPGYFLKAHIGMVENTVDLQWEQADSENGAYEPIDGETNTILKLTNSQLGKYVRLKVVFNDEAHPNPLLSDSFLIKSPDEDGYLESPFVGDLTTDHSYFQPVFPTDNPEGVYDSTNITEVSAEKFNYLYTKVTPSVTGDYMLWVGKTNFVKEDPEEQVEKPANQDPVIFIYEDAFDPEKPLEHLLLVNDDMQLGTEIIYRQDPNRMLSYIPKIHLDRNKKYFLVLSTFEHGVAGHVDFKSLGPGKLEVQNPNPIYDLTAAAGNGKAVLTFSAPTDAQSVTLQQFDEVSGNWQDVTAAALTNASTTVTVTGLENAKKYQFRLSVIEGPREGFSNIAEVTPSASVLSSAKAITSLGFNSLSAQGTIDENSGDIAVIVPHGTDVSKLTPAIVHTGSSVSPDSGIEQNFTAPVTYKVTAEDGSTKDYTVKVTTANSVPASLADPSYETNQDAPLTVNAADGVLANDTDGDQDPLTAVKLTNPTHGTLQLNADGSFVYTPVIGYTGTDQFTYRSYDGFAYSEAATVTINVKDMTQSLKPAITLTPSSWTNGSVTAEVYGNAGGSIEYRIGNSGSWFVYASPLTLTQEGEYELQTRQHSTNGSTSDTATANVRIDKTKPVLVLNGNADVFLYQNEPFADPGAQVTDNYSTGLQAAVTGAADTSTLGEYKLKYNVTDEAGNAADEVTRTVHVMAKPLLHFGSLSYDMKESEQVPFTLKLFSDGQEVDVTAWGQYSFSPNGVAKVASTGALEGVTAGSTVLKAVYGGQYEAAASITVNPAEMVPTPESDIKDALQLISIGYAGGDSWESVTQNVILPTAGAKGTDISWSSSRPQIVSAQGLVNRSSDKDENVLLTAAVSKQGKTAFRTFLLVVKKGSLIVVGEDTSRTAPVRVGEGQTNVQQTTIVRKTMSDGTKVDKVDVDDIKARAALNEALTHNQHVVRVVVPDLPADKADEVAIQVPSAAYADMAGVVDLAFETEEANIVLPAATIQLLKNEGSDLFFKFVPIRNQQQVQQLTQQAIADPVVSGQAANKIMSQIGTPMTIDTNYPSGSNYETKLVFPLSKLNAPADPVEQLAYLSKLSVYVEHSDGTKEFLKANLEKDTAGTITGVSIIVNKFSTFTLLKIDDKHISRGSKGGASSSTTTPEVIHNSQQPETIKIVYKAYIDGYENGMFLPGRTVTRAELAAMLWRILEGEGSSSSLPVQASFDDVPSTHWAYAAVEALRSKGIMQGAEEGQFQPDRPLSRAEFAVIAVRWKQLKAGSAHSFSDAANHWAEKEISALSQAGIVNGYDDGLFHPNDGVTRAEAVTMLNKLMNRVPDKNAAKQSWQDVTPAHWAFFDIEEAARTHTEEAPIQDTAETEAK